MGVPATGFWKAPGRVDHLRKLLADPERLSASQIADRLGCARNAVIGKVHRLGLDLPQAGTNAGTARNMSKVKKKGVHLSSRPRGASRLASGRGGEKSPTAGRPCGPGGPTNAQSEAALNREDNDHNPVSFVDVIGRSGRCKFPTGEHDAPAGPDMPVCGAPVLSPKAQGMCGSYCAHHYDRCTGDGTRAERAVSNLRKFEETW